MMGVAVSQIGMLPPITTLQMSEYSIDQMQSIVEYQQHPVTHR